MDDRVRIVGSGVKPASEFMAHPENFRQHPELQRAAVAESLETLGWIAPVIENVSSGYLLDGHERIWQAMQHGDEMVPYVQVELSDEEEALALLTFDAITEMAIPEPTHIQALINRAGDLAQGAIKAVMHSVKAKAESMARVLGAMQHKGEDTGEEEDEYCPECGQKIRSR